MTPFVPHLVLKAGLLSLTLFFGLIERAGAQTSPAPVTGQSLPASKIDSPYAPPDAAELNDPSDPRPRTTRLPEKGAALSSSQLINLLQQRPEALVEVKGLAADRLQERGAELQADDITDEMLYTQIGSDSSLRASITTFLRARGYISDRDMQSAPITTPENELGLQRPLSPGRTPPQPTLIDRSNRDTLDPRTPVPLSEGVTRETTERKDTAQPEPFTPRQEPQRDEAAKASTDDPTVLHVPAPYNLRSMRDLYTQIPEHETPLKRFGADVFVHRDLAPMNRGTDSRDTPLDVPVGPDYIVGAGDTLTMDLWGGTTQTFSRSVDRDGRILLPEAGSLQVAGLSLNRVQELVGKALQRQFRNAHVTVTVAKLRSVRVYVVGDVQRPGGYDISALATPVSALYAAGGPTAAGSLRTLRHMRGTELVEQVDLYDFLLEGLRSNSARFESGDTLLVPPAGAQVAISGAVKRPAIYEVIPAQSTVAALVADAGGLTAAASLEHAFVERIGPDHLRETIAVPSSREINNSPAAGAFQSFTVKDGDRIVIPPILPSSQRVVYLDGHVPRPGRVPYNDDLKLGDVLRSYRDLLPEPAAHGEVVRLVPPDLHAETIDFSVPDVLTGSSNLNLQPFDTIRVFGRYAVDAPRVTIHGEVLRPGSFPLSVGMTAAQLVRIAGGFRRDAFLEAADLTSYAVEGGRQVVGSLASVPIGAAVSGSDRQADVPLKAGDVLTIRQITGWNDIGQSITVKGQVNFPGSYGFREGELLSSVLRRAGSFRETAYPTGAVLVREQVRELEEKSREELIRQIETSSAQARLSPALGSADTGATLQLIKAQQDDVLARLRSEPPSGRLVLHISAEINSWANTPADIELRRGDVLTVPKRPGFVLITGQVYNATALTFTPGQTAGWYLSHAGGTSATANRKEIFVIRANGSIIGRHSSGLFGGNVLSTRLDPGDVVVVPQKVVGGSLFWRNLLTAAQLASSIAVTAAVTGL